MSPYSKRCWESGSLTCPQYSYHSLPLKFTCTVEYLLLYSLVISWVLAYISWSRYAVASAHRPLWSSTIAVDNLSDQFSRKISREPQICMKMCSFVAAVVIHTVHAYFTFFLRKWRTVVTKHRLHRVKMWRCPPANSKQKKTKPTHKNFSLDYISEYIFERFLILNSNWTYNY